MKLKTLAIWGLILCASVLLAGLLGIAAMCPEVPIAFTWGVGVPVLGSVTFGGRGIKFYDWSKAKGIKPDELRKNIVDRFGEIIKEIDEAPIEGQKITGHDINLQGPAPIVLVTSDSIKMPDRGYELLFDEVDMRQSSNDTFELLGISGGVTFYQQLPGEKAKLSKIPKSAKTQVGFLRFTGGFPILDDWIRFNQYYKIDELTADTIRDWYQQKATLFYGLMAALDSSINQAFDTDDVTTINNACAAILVALRAKGYSVGENETFSLTCNPSLRGRIYKALAASFVNPNANNNQIIYNISALISTTEIANTSYYVSLPGRKNKRGEWDNLNARPPQRDELMLGADHVWTGAYNGIIGEKDQHRRCSLS